MQTEPRRDYPTTTVMVNHEPEEMTPAQVVNWVYDALREKGYNPSLQLSGYLLTGDPTYITSFKNARNLITRFERDEVLSTLIEEYICLQGREGK